MSLLSQNLEAFLAISSQGTVHSAAKTLHLTQTGVTQRIRSLENELKTTLFLRSRMGMKLTREGQALLVYCKGVQDLEGFALSQIHNGGIKTKASVNIAGPTSILTSRIAPKCIPLYLKWPELFINFAVDDHPDLIGYLRKGTADLVVTPHSLVPLELESKVLKPQKYLLVCTRLWFKRSLQDIVNQEKIIDFSEIDSTTTRYLQTFGIKSDGALKRVFVNNNETLCQFFCAGVGFGTLCEEIAGPLLKSGHLITLNRGQALKESLALVWHRRPLMPDYFKAVIDQIIKAS